MFLWWAVTSAMLVLGSEAVKERPVEVIPRRPGEWNRVLATLSNGTRKVDRDPILEGLFKQTFYEVLKPAIRDRRPLFGGATLDPMWLWPMDMHIKQDVFEGDFSACNLHMHNFKSARIVAVEVRRTDDLNSAAVRIVFHFPILWITGYYQLVRQIFFGFVPAKSRRGDFNIDIKHVTVNVITTMTLPQTEAQDLMLDEFIMNLQFGDIAVNFERIAGRLSGIAHMTMNQLGMGRAFVNKQKRRMDAELRVYTEAVLNCVLKTPARGIELCMRSWWETQGWTWPWQYPPCHRQ